MGPRHRRAGRPRPRLAGPPHRRRLPRAPGRGHPHRRRTCRPPRSSTCSTSPTPTARRDLCVGTVDTWIAWRLSEGAAPRHRRHQRRPHRRLTDRRLRGWDDARCSTHAAHPEPRRCPPSSTRPASSARPPPCPGAPPIAGIAGDQQASLLGQGCIAPGIAKITFGTGGMLDTVVGADRPTFDPRGGHGCFPIVAHRIGGDDHVGRRGGDARRPARTSSGCATTSASCPTAEASHEVAASVPDAGGAWYVPALLGLGTPQLGLRRPGHAARHHPRHHRRPRRAGRARGRRPPRRRPRRGGRGRRRRTPIGAAPGRRRHVGQPHVRAGPRRRRRSGRSRCRRCSRPRPSAPPSSPASPSARGRRSTRSPPRGSRPRVVEPGAPDRPRPLARGRRAAPAAWIPELSALDF